MNETETTLAPPVGPDDHIDGPDDAPITLVEYGDYQCPYCGQAYLIVKALQRELGSSMRLVFRNMPLANVHPHAEDAAEFAEAVSLQVPFWPIHDTLYENQGDLSDSALLRYAAGVGADVEELKVALEAGEARRRVQGDLESGIRSGVNGTPTFFVNGVRYDDSWNYETFLAHLQELL
ncbi:MAG: thioredoxin domain-containing protein [Acidimicrobiales bacterium]